MKPISVRITYSPDEYRRALRDAALVHMNPRLELFSLVVTGVVATGAASSFNLNWPVPAFVTYAALYLYGLAYKIFIFPSKSAKLLETTGSLTVDFSINDSAFVCESNDLNIRASWPLFKRWNEGTDHFFLLTKAGGTYIVPKRAFPSEAARDEFKALIAAIIGGHSTTLADTTSYNRPTPRWMNILLSPILAIISLALLAFGLCLVSLVLRDLGHSNTHANHTAEIILGLVSIGLAGLFGFWTRRVLKSDPDPT